MPYSVLFLSLSLIFGYVEALLPLNIGYIGVKIGLSNIITILALKFLTVKRTFVINLLRLIILGILFSNIIRFFISVSGFLISFFVMVLMLNVLNRSIIISSIFGGIFHNIGQILAVAFFNFNPDNYYAIFSLLPIYIVIGAITGLVIGLISNFLYKVMIKVLIE